MLTLSLVLGALATAVNIGLARVRAGRRLGAGRVGLAMRGAVVVYGAYYVFAVAAVGALSAEAGTMEATWYALMLYSLVGVGLWVLPGHGLPFVAALDRAMYDRELSEWAVRFRYGHLHVGIGVLAPAVHAFLFWGGPTGSA